MKDLKAKFGSIAIWAIMIWCIIVTLLFVHSMITKIYLQTDAREAELLSKISAMRSTMSYLTDQYIPEPNIEYTSPMVIDDFERYSSPFGIRNNPLKANIGGSDTTIHNGVDICGVPEARVASVSRGIILEKYFEPGWHFGRLYKGHPIYEGYIKLGHIDADGNLTGVISHYGHLGEIYVREGDIVEQGAVIARISDKIGKRSTGAHLHFGLEYNDEALPPFKYVNMP